MSELGYEPVATIVRAALAEHRSFLDVAVERGLLRQEDVRSAMRRAAVEPPGASGDAFLKEKNQNSGRKR
ncbi:hypothetical protein [Bradyrhizobium mercantei]|uniref:hypothetical protein n=1 Tax=Bradyrhizobium mercantei TaxID=1904807 RepID=UPI001FDA8FCD|nr:hypothetical protein [Bradyrhizobium mercantei]